MSDQDRENQIFREELERQREAQAERDFLKDKSIGGNAPRPSDDFIERSLGRDQTPREQTHTASEITDKRLQQEHNAEAHREEVERSKRAHQEHNVEGSRRSFAEKMEQAKGRDAIDQARAEASQAQALSQKQTREREI
jgi:hypothetical protein